jgi:Double-GTPase 1
MGKKEIATVLIIGEFGVGKTHFGAQLLLRLNQGQSFLRMRGAAENISAFESAVECLNEGRAAAHTATSTYVKSIWPIQDREGHAMDLVWPEYGGEQIRQMFANRKFPSAWRDRVKESSAWMLFVRIQQADSKDDIFSRPISTIHKSPPADKDFRVSDQSRLVELLQSLLFLEGVGTLRQVSSPALTLLLSCWDEIVGVQKKSRPGEVLAKHLPLLADFVTATWTTEALSIVGLSALERPLREDSRDEDYINRGPNQFGYIVGVDGTHHKDLTIPVGELARRAK